MTEEQLREPRLLSDGELQKAYAYRDIHIPISYARRIVEAGAQAQREADIKWMEEHCYLKAERELPENPVDKKYTITSAKRYVYWKAQADMLQEVDGVSFKAVRGWE